MPIPLVIVESPAKARTLSRFLGKKYRVEASYGHIRDLPESAAEVPAEIKGKSWGRLGIDTDGEFTPYYVVPGDKKKNVTALKAAMKDASELILATDPDREGEAISWHLKELLKPKVKVRRIVFHEITEEAVKAALAEQHDIDENLVRAQESRRILDRLYGYTLSPVLWKKVQTGLSAGRVQSVAVRVIVEREEERLAFRTASYWDLEAKLRGGAIEFGATLAKIGGQRVATGKDFDSKGVLESNTVRLLDETTATELRETLMRKLPWSVTSVEEKPFTQRPSPPFTTSTLQQEANRKLGFSSERTMQIAQRLFQGMDLGGGDLEGLISYHRTDSTTLSSKALVEAQHAVVELYGADFHKGPRQYQTKVRNAQEAHEAIRPTDFRRTPASLERILESDEMRVYDLIWKRAVASQMADAKLLRTSVEITGETSNGVAATFNASGKAIEFAGYLRAYVEGSDDPSAELLEQDTVLPKLSVGDPVWSPDKLDQELILLGLDAKGHQTSPPARYTEASLVKKLEEEGIGRPSTYAPTVATIQRRGYISRQGKALVPSFTAFAVTRLLRNHFGDYVDLAFTAEMEEILDKISNGEKDWLVFLAEFYRGDGKHPGLEHLVEDKGQAIEYPIIELGIDPESNLPIRVRIGRYGPFLQMGSQADGGPRASLPEDLAPADLTLDKAIALLKAKAQGPKSLGVDEPSGQHVYIMHGRFGAYVQLGETPEDRDIKPRRASLGRDHTEETITLDIALKLLSLPRELGAADDGEVIL
ncbi:MAG: type I DNA topoisomerase, partial [Acidobacteriota bacterium]|nr:type I DNA topoisomerase [Acidobacteriota bacterium]